VLAALSVCTWIQIGYWRNTVALFTHAIAVSKDNYLAHDMVGAALSREGKNQQAIEHFNEAIRIKPSDAFAYNNLGNAYTRIGRLPSAVAAYDEAIRIKPDTEQAHFNRGMALVLLGRINEAVSEFSTVMEIDRQARGQPEIFTTRPEENAATIRKFEKAVSDEPGDEYLQSRLAMAYAQAGKLEEAVAILSRIAQSDGGSPSIETSGDRVTYYRSLLNDDPRNADAHYGLANALSDSGRKEEAVLEFRAAIRLKPDYLGAHNNLAVALYFTGRYAEAWDEVRECRRLGAEPHPGFIKALSAKMADPGN
jgi:Flp pilus assembly protein TadD